MKPVDIVKRLQSTNSRLDKEAILLDAWNAGCLEFFEGAKLCYDGLVTFGVKQVPVSDSCNNYYSFDNFLNLSSKLSSRTLTGHAARDAIIEDMNKCAAGEWNLFYRPILLKDLKCGLSETTINKVLKSIGKETLSYQVMEFPYQRCCLPKDTKLDSFSWEDGVYSQKKLDGMFVNFIIYNDGSSVMLGRSGKQFPLDEFNTLVNELSMFTKNTQLHGELLVYRNGKELPREQGNGILNSVLQGGNFDSGDTPVYVVWDQIPLTSVVSKGVCNVPYKTRLLNLETQTINSTSVKLIETKIVHSMSDAKSHYIELVSQGFEGTIIKEPTAIWKDGTSKFQVKLKVDADVDLVIKGFNKGNGKNEVLFGSIVCQTSDGLLEVGVSGFKDAERERIWNNREALIGSIMTVKGNGIMKPSSEGKLYSIFLPRFVEFRTDKSVADDLQRVIDQFEAALKV